MGCGGETTIPKKRMAQADSSSEIHSLRLAIANDGVAARLFYYLQALECQDVWGLNGRSWITHDEMVGLMGRGAHFQRLRMLQVDGSTNFSFRRIIFALFGYHGLELPSLPRSGRAAHLDNIAEKFTPSGCSSVLIRNLKDNVYSRHADTDKRSSEVQKEVDAYIETLERGVDQAEKNVEQAIAVYNNEVADDDKEEEEEEEDDDGDEDDDDDEDDDEDDDDTKRPAPKLSQRLLQELHDCKGGEGIFFRLDDDSETTYVFHMNRAQMLPRVTKCVIEHRRCVMEVTDYAEAFITDIDCMLGLTWSASSHRIRAIGPCLTTRRPDAWMDVRPRGWEESIWRVPVKAPVLLAKRPMTGPHVAHFHLNTDYIFGVDTTLKDIA